MRRLLFSLVLLITSALPLSAATVDGLKLHSSSAGKGPKTLILVHGWTCDDSSWVSQVGHFLMMEEPDEFNRLVVAFLNKVKY